MALKFTVTAGPTREFIDPVRFISNRSTGKMGFAIATAAAYAGYEVNLVAGPVQLATPDGVNRVDVVTAREMLDVVKSLLHSTDVLVMTAAVADWRPKYCADIKLKKSEMPNVLELEPNPDILRSLLPLKGERFFAGFAAETGDPVAEARRKLSVKGLDMIVANDVTEPGSGFAVDTNRVTIITPEKTSYLPQLRKIEVAQRIVSMIASMAKEVTCQPGSED